MRDERLARYLAAAERRQMRRILLAVYHFYFVTSQVADQRGQRHFRAVGDVGVHRFPEEHPPERHAVQTAYAPALEPCFDAVRAAEAMQRRIGFDDVGGDPRAALAASRRLRAGAHHGGEILI